MPLTNRNVQYLAGICVSFAFTFTGACISWPSPAIPKFKNGEAGITITDVQTSWMVSLAPLGSLPGCYIGRVLCERIGRRKTVICAALPGFVAVIFDIQKLVTATLIIFTLMYLFKSIFLLTKSWLILCVARILAGLSNGITAVVTMVYLTEIADKEIRGALGMLVQVMNNLGSLAVYSIGPFVSYTALNSMLLFFSVFYAVICLWIPESPYYYLKVNKIAEARKEFAVIKGCKNEKWIDEQLEVIRLHVQESMQHKTSTKELFTNVKYRKSVYIVAGLKILQYMTGILAIQSYLEIIFRQSSSISGPYASIVYGFVQLAGGVAATFLAGIFGRRILMMVSSIGVAISLTLVGMYFFLQDRIQLSAETMTSIAAMPLVGVLSFNILYSIGLGNLPYVMQAELFPMNVKTTASSTATMMACILNFIVMKSYQGIKDGMGHYTVFWFFASIGYLGMLFIYMFVPETKGKTLEEVQDNMTEMREIEPLNREDSDKLKS